MAFPAANVPLRRLHAVQGGWLYLGEGSDPEHHSRLVLIVRRRRLPDVLSQATLAFSRRHTRRGTGSAALPRALPRMLAANLLPWLWVARGTRGLTQEGTKMVFSAHVFKLKV